MERNLCLGPESKARSGWGTALESAEPSADNGLKRSRTPSLSENKLAKAEVAQKAEKQEEPAKS